MSQLWNFSPSSEPYLQRCIEAALLQDNDNKWTDKFGRKSTKNLDNSSIVKENTPMEVVDILSPAEEIVENNPPVIYDEFFENLDIEVRLDFVVEECAKNPELLLKMAERLTSNTVDKLFNLIFTSQHNNSNFLQSLLTKFLPLYLKQKNRISVDILIQTGEKYPEILQELLKILLLDTEIPNELLNSYINTLNGEKCTNFLENLINFNIPIESFNSKVSTIEMAYTNSVKTEKIQNYIKKCLVTHKNSCVDNKNYGRLFMSFLKAEKLLSHKINVKELEDCLEIHRSPFKRPCLTLLKELEQ